MENGVSPDSTQDHVRISENGHPNFLEMNGGTQRTDELPRTLSWLQIVLGKQVADRDFHGRGWRVAPYILAGEFGEKVSSFGLQFTLLSYLMNELNYPLAKAATATTDFLGASFVATLGGAFIADAFLGRFLTLTLGSLFYIVGLAVFTVSAMFGVFRPDTCSADERIHDNCQRASVIQVFVLGMALSLLCVGSGAVKPSAPPFGADQFDKSNTKHVSQLRHFFNWYYTVLAFAMLVSLIVVVRIQDSVGWGWAGLFCSSVVAVGTVIFLLGSPKFVYAAPTGSVLTTLFRVVVAALRKRKLTLPRDPDDLYEARNRLEDKENQVSGHEPEDSLAHTDNFRLLDKAAILEDLSEEPDERKRRHPWRLATVHQVEELKIMLRIVPVWLTSIVSAMVILQASTFVQVQAQTLNRNVVGIKIPSAAMPLFGVITLLLFIPFYDLVLTKTLRKFTGNPKGISYLQRIGAGLSLSILTVACSALVETKRKGFAQKSHMVDDTRALHMSVLWLVPQLILSGLTESFVAIGQLEFFYDEAPVSVRSLSNALVWTALGIGAFTNSVIVKLVQGITDNSSGGWLQNNINRGQLDAYYWLLTCFAAANFLAFLFISSWYVYKNTDRHDDRSNDHESKLDQESEEQE